jgi:hypothetical protein
MVGFNMLEPGRLVIPRCSSGSCSGCRWSRRGRNTGWALPPLMDGGWYSSQLLPARLGDHLVDPDLCAGAAQDGQAGRWAFASAIWLFLVLGLFRRS